MHSSNTSPFASVTGLGAFQSEHKPANINRIINLVLGIGLIVGAPIACMVGVWMGWDAYQSHGLNRIIDSGFLLPLLCAVVILPAGGWVLFNVIRSWSVSLALYEGGFAYYDRNGLKQIKWGDIDAVWQSITKHYTYGVHTRTTYLYTIQLNDKTKITLDNKFPQIEQVGKAISNGSATALFPKYVALLKAGQRATFGPLALDANGMYSGNKSLTWQEIKAVKIVRGIISVKKEGGWFNWATASVPQVPNFWIFIDLVSRFTKVE
jgi:hypothetical protein